MAQAWERIVVGKHQELFCSNLFEEPPPGGYGWVGQKINDRLPVRML